jgi:hypothetical protein
MYLAAESAGNWPDTIFVLGSMGLGIVALIALLATLIEFRKTKMNATQQDAMRQLVSRYEQLAENTLDAQQRVAADLSELRTRTASVEQILRTVE